MPLARVLVGAQQRPFQHGPDPEAPLAGRQCGREWTTVTKAGELDGLEGRLGRFDLGEVEWRVERAVDDSPLDLWRVDRGPGTQHVSGTQACPRGGPSRRNLLHDKAGRGMARGCGGGGEGEAEREAEEGELVGMTRAAHG